MADVVAAIGERAAAAGVAIRESEVVGLLPQDALVRLAQAALYATDFSARPGARGPGPGHAAVMGDDARCRRRTGAGVRAGRILITGSASRRSS